ncbi:MAG: anaerobic ribonucleoside-triphosphate reductase activating protein [Oscillospiraceae bacterium]|nr:anaerobic ribonucleoside-triphosphate reductase activating protein [Oscillospiraceae bacterium]
MLSEKIKLAGVANDSIVDGPGLRYTLFTQGCPHGCEGCQNPQTHDFCGGRESNINEALNQITSNKLLDGVTFSGGEPFCQARALYRLGLQVKGLGLSLITYTGYTYEELCENADNKNCYRELLSVTDYLVDGRFDIGKKDYRLRFKGSSNQRVIDVRRSMAAGRAIEAAL